MAIPTLAYCAERGRLVDGKSCPDRSNASITPEVIKAYSRRGRELRAKAFTDGLATLSSRITSLVRAVGDYQSNRRAIRELRGMPDYLLEDIGISRSDIPAVVQGISAPDRAGNDYRVRAARPAEPAVVGDGLKRAA